MNIRQDPEMQQRVQAALDVLGRSRGDGREELLWLLVELAHSAGVIATHQSALDALAAIGKKEAKA